MSHISIQNLSKSYGAKLAINDLSLDVADGEMVVLLGPSGCGKSTLLRCIAGLERPTAGSIELGNKVVFDAAKRAIVPPYDRNVGFVFQSFALWPHMTVTQNIAYPLRVRGQLKQSRPRIEEMLRKVRCAELGDRLPSELSGGQQQRVALARALIAEPKVMLLDEPLSNLDAQLRLELRRQLREIHQAFGFTGIFVTHDQAEAMHVGNRVALMNKGCIEQIGRPDEIYEAPVTPYAARFLGVQNLVPSSTGAARRINGQAMLSLGESGAGSPVELGFRARDVVLQQGSAASWGGELVGFGDGKVTDLVYLGDTVECVVQLGAATVTAAVNRAPAWLIRGTSVSVAAPLDALLVYVDGRLTPGALRPMFQ